MERSLTPIAGLVEKSLIATRLDQGEPQYRLLDTTRAYALEKLEEHGELDPISLRHAEYVIQQLESQKETLSALPSAEGVAAYSWQLSNVRSALEWSFGAHGNDEIATRLAAASTQLFLELSLLIECQVWAERAIARLGDQRKNSRRDMEISTSLSFALMHTEGSSELVRKTFRSGARRCGRAGRPCLRVAASERALHVFALEYRHQCCARYRRSKQKSGLENRRITTTWRSLNRCWAPPIIWLEITSSR